ncbi:MAG: amidohydrolase family protein, partial [Chloroflexi bacterium]|nr:amidohydrolase family protein [Chloroflexota bacterium]
VHAHFPPESCSDLMPSGSGRNPFGPAANLKDDPSNLNARLRAMDERGVDIQLVSGPNWLQNAAPDQCRRLNDAVAEAIDGSDRLIGLASVPMQEPEAAAAELERCTKGLGFRGLEMLTNVNGENLDNPRFTPLYKKMEELEVAAFIHPNAVLGADRLGSYFLNNLIGNPTDTSVAVASLIFGGVLAEMPTLKFVLSHGGGTAPALRGRWEHGWRQGLVETPITRPPSEYFKLLYFDTITHSVPVLNHLVETVGPERVMLGSDYPFGMGDYAPAEAVAALPHISDAQREAINGGNAIRVFGLDL